MPQSGQIPKALKNLENCIVPIGVVWDVKVQDRVFQGDGDGLYYNLSGFSRDKCIHSKSYILTICILTL